MRHLGRTIEERFWSKVRKDRDSHWRWIGANNGIGYGKFWIAGVGKTYAHRTAYGLLVGEVPSDKIVMHSCDVPACVNPDHLALGTMKENTQDAIRKGRISSGKVHGATIKNRMCGTKNHRSKLTEADIPVILALHKQGVSRDRIGEIFGVTRATIRPIVLGIGWKHVQTTIS